MRYVGGGHRKKGYSFNGFTFEPLKSLLNLDRRTSSSDLFFHFLFYSEATRPEKDIVGGRRKKDCCLTVFTESFSDAAQGLRLNAKVAGNVVLGYPLY